MHRLATILFTVALAVSALGPARAIDSTDASRIILLLVVVDDKARDDVKSWINLFQNNVQSLLDDFSFGGSGAARGIKVDVIRKDVKEPAKRNELEASFEQ